MTPDPAQLLKTEDSRLRLIADTLPAYIAYVDDQLRYVMVNRTYEDWFGLRHDEIVGRLVAEVLGPSYGNVKAHIEGALAGRKQVFETRMKTVEGDRFLSVVHIPDLDAEGQVRGIIIHGHDVTARKAMDDDLRVSEERFRIALAAADGIGTWDWDVPNDRVRADLQFARLYQVDAVLASQGIPIALFLKNIHPEDLERVTKAVSEALLSGEEYACEYRIVFDDSSTRWISARGRCLFAADGTPSRFPGVVIDVTDRKRQEQALIQSEKLAAVGRLASSISHEINNPLESVVNLLYLIEHSSKDAATISYAQTAQEELARVGQIVTQTLRFFKQSTAPTLANPTELIHSVLALYRGRLTHARILIDRRIRTERTGYLFEDELRQILNNLIGNALDAMRDGGYLAVRAQSTRDWKTSQLGLRITVSDSGAGMSSAVAAKAFDPFFTTKGNTGTGLGLWVTSQLLEKNGGRTSLRSRHEGKQRGTVFSLFIPYLPDPAG